MAVERLASHDGRYTDQISSIENHHGELSVSIANGLTGRTNETFPTDYSSLTRRENRKTAAG